MFTNNFISSFPDASYQTFPDSAQCKTAPSLGSLQDITKEELQQLNKQGNGIFFSPNGMEHGTRSIKTCTHVNAFFVDMDEGTKEEQFHRITHAPAHPSYIVESKNGYHIYFPTTDATIKDFTTIQTQLINYYQGDKQCKDISRVLRIPGFFHLKDLKQPFKVTLLDDNADLKYTQEEIVELFNIDLNPPQNDTPRETSAKQHTAPQTFWEHLASMNCVTALTALSGTTYVNGEIYSFPPRSKGGFYIEVNGKMSNAWIDTEGFIGSGAKGGPTVIQWLQYYGYDYSRIAAICRVVFKDSLPQEILTGEIVSERTQSLAITSERTFEVTATENIKTVQALSDTFIALHGDRLFFCPEDQMVYIYDEQKNYHQGLTHLTADKYINNYLIDGMQWFKNVDETLCNAIHRQIKHRAPSIEYTTEPYISLSDGLINLETLQLEPHNKQIFCPFHLDISYEEMVNQPTPRFDQFVDEIMVTEEDTAITDPDLKELYLQTMGYFLSPVKRPHAFIFFIGEQGRNGKGVSASILENIFSPVYRSSMSLQELTTNPHAAASLIGKRINIAGEDESQYISNDILKKLASDDSLEANPKFVQSFTFKPRAKYLLMSNGTPKFSHIDNAMKRRIVIVPFNREFKDNEVDWSLTDKLTAELPGIIYKIAQAYTRLIKNNYTFHRSEQSLKAMSVMEEEVSATINWFRTHFSPAEEFDGQFYSTEDLYEMFKLWCIDSGRKTVSKMRWVREVGKEFSLNSHRKYIEGRQERGYYLVNKTTD